ncbi:unnamed protein product [Rhodiola kirilowii]
MSLMSIVQWAIESKGEVERNRSCDLTKAKRRRSSKIINLGVVEGRCVLWSEVGCDRKIKQQLTFDGSKRTR